MRCEARLKNGKQCTRMAPGSAVLCWQHARDTPVFLDANTATKKLKLSDNVKKLSRRESLISAVPPIVPPRPQLVVNNAILREEHARLDMELKKDRAEVERLNQHVEDLQQQLESYRNNLAHCEKQSSDLQRALDDHVALHPPNTLPSSAQQVLAEIISTESVYVNHLSKVANTVIPHLRQMCQVNNEKLDAIFSNWTNIALANSNFLREMMSNPTSLLVVMEAFSQHVASFSLYGEYYRNYNRGIKSLTKLRERDPRINRYLDSVKLSDMMILPVQRLPRYVLLLTELSKKVQQSNTTLVCMVLKSVKDLTAHLNDQIKP